MDKYANKSKRFDRTFRTEIKNIFQKNFPAQIASDIFETVNLEAIYRTFVHLKQEDNRLGYPFPLNNAPLTFLEANVSIARSLNLM